MNEDGPLSAVITAYLQAVDAGEQPDRDEVLARHPEVAGELRRFFATQDRLTEMAGPLRPGPPAAAGRFGDYEILGEIGRGGMGVVYRARQVSLNRVVALKMLAAGCAEEQSERLRQESRLLAELEHPHIVPVYDVGQHEGRAFFAMKEIEGRNLEEALPALRNEIPQGVRVLAVVARAVHFAHQKGVLHRDLKPSNVLLGVGQAFQPDSSKDVRLESLTYTPYVTDFGLARRLDNVPALTQTGALVGTPAYMAPEQATGDRGLTPAVDVWALGVMLYRLLTGELPYRGDTPLETLHLIVAGRLRPPGKVAPGVDRALEAVCLRCLKSDPHDRYQTADEVAEDLERWLKGERVSACGLKRRVGSWAGRMKRRALRSWWLLLSLPLLAAGGYGLAVIGAAAWKRDEEASVMDREEFLLEFLLKRGEVEAARELFEARGEWPVAQQDDPVRERRERMRRLFEGHLFSVRSVRSPDGPQSDRSRWQLLDREWEREGPEELSRSPDGSLVLWQFIHAKNGLVTEREASCKAFVQMLREADLCDNLIDADDLDRAWCVPLAPRGSLAKVNWFQKGPGGGQGSLAFNVYLLCHKGQDAKPFRAFVLPACRYMVSWSDDGQQIFFYDIYQSFSPRQLTYDLRIPGWVRIVDSRPAIWRPPAAPDRTRVSYPPDQSRCDDAGELEILTFLRSHKDTGECKMDLSRDGTRVQIQWKQKGPDTFVNVWRLPGAPSR